MLCVGLIHVCGGGGRQHRCVVRKSLRRQVDKLALVPPTGQISVQRAILEVRRHRGKYKESVEAFIEEAVVRRELADNFCYYNQNYDKVEGDVSSGGLCVPPSYKAAVQRVSWQGGGGQHHAKSFCFCWCPALAQTEPPGAQRGGL